MAYIKKERSTLCETCGETDEVKLLKYKPICYSCVGAKKVKSPRPVECEMCGETDEDKLTKRKPICYSCRDKVYYKKSREGKPFGRQNIKIIINIPDGVENRSEYYKKEYSRISHQQNKEHRRERLKYNKRIKLLKKYCTLLDRDFNEYLKDNQSDNELKEINASLIKEYRGVKKAIRKASKPKNIFDREYYTSNFKNKLKDMFGDTITLSGDYINGETKTMLSCKEHGEFQFVPRRFSRVKHPCPSCRGASGIFFYQGKPNVEGFKSKLHEKFGNHITLYGEYVNGNAKTILNCKEHGNFEFIPTYLNKIKYPCPYCRIEHGFAQSEIEQGSIVKGLTDSDLIQKSIELYGDKYGYSKFKYVNKKSKVIFTCKEHGEFEQKYESHIMGFQGCKKCPPHDKTMFSDKMLGHKLYTNLRDHITRSLKHLGIEYKKYDVKYSSIKICGLKKEDFLKYIETKMEPWMTWSNYGLYNGTPNYGWDLDHVIPRSTVKTIEDFYTVYHYSNIQPLCSYLNRDVKKDKISE